MKISLLLGVAVALLLPTVACGPKTYPIRFVCGASGGTDCPPGSECPALPLGADTCGDLPGLFGHQPIRVTYGRPVGCEVGLPYGNPYYSDTQQGCTCSTLGATTSQASPQWICGI